MSGKRIAMIDQKLARMERQRRDKEREDERLLQEANRNCKALSERVAELIYTANYLLDHGIQLPGRYDLINFGYKYDAWADGIAHGVGFLTADKMRRDHVEYVGIIKGGACGPWDFFMDGGTFFCRHEKTHEIYPASRQTLEQFIDRFPKFESAFYAWVDYFCKK